MTSNGLGQRSGEAPAITAISVSNFKSLVSADRVPLRDLTVLAGANSSGKSTLLQPALLLKQTLEVSYDPGPLLLDGGHVRFSSSSEILNRRRGNRAGSFSAGFDIDGGRQYSSRFEPDGEGLAVRETTYGSGDRSITITPDLASEEIDRRLRAAGDVSDRSPLRWEVVRHRPFLTVATEGSRFGTTLGLTSSSHLEKSLLHILHVPGIRGNPKRTYPTTGSGPLFPGTFETYVATAIHRWQADDGARVERLGEQLASLGLTGRVVAEQLDATRLELKVGRLLRNGGARDLVSIADVGFGVSQVLPVVVALILAEVGRMVYVEQPEIHLHPKAQVALARILVDAANRGVRVVVETHSELLLLSLQSHIAEGTIDPSKVLLHWFERQKDGSTRITSVEPDENGAYGEWPEDFGDVQLKAQSRYLDAVDSRFFRSA